MASLDPVDSLACYHFPRSLRRHRGRDQRLVFHRTPHWVRKGDGGHGALGGDGRVHPCFGYQSDDDDDACVDERAKVRLRLWPRALLLLVGEYYVHD